ncbi:hypothetical protein M5C99_18275 [Acidovorax sp. NCPPB 2350]|nr:hypothetical protein M5C99_18275 [Acidovorax sp. NCPPB 2350]
MVVIKARLFAAQSPESGLGKIGEALCNVADPVDFAAQAWEINDVEGECDQRLGRRAGCQGKFCTTPPAASIAGPASG